MFFKAYLVKHEKTRTITTMKANGKEFHFQLHESTVQQEVVCACSFNGRESTNQQFRLNISCLNCRHISSILYESVGANVLQVMHVT